jgi:CubicO group peptidase (beta-lactamase class C family)
VLDGSFSQTLEEAAVAWEVPALAVGVSVGGVEETLARGCDPDTRFHVASITKPFTALLALELLDLDAPTGVWPAEVRVRNLLAHTSGYACEHGDLARFGDGDGALAAVVRELPQIRRLAGTGACWSYANTGYWLAGGLCAEAAGTSYEDALAERVLGPAGLGATSFAPADVAGSGPEATAARYPRARRPSGGLVSNVPDLLRFGRRLLAVPDLRVVHGKPPAGVYGLGLFGERVGGVDVWGHGGSWGGYQSSLLLVPSRQAVFAGLTNASRGGKVRRALEDEFLARLLGARRRRPDTVALSAEDLRAVAGSYSNGDDRFEVEPVGEGVQAGFPDGVFTARPIGRRTFEVTDGARVDERFDFPLPGFGRFDSRLAERIG